MPTPIANNDELLCRVACFANDQVSINTYYYVLHNAVGANTLEGFASGWDSMVAALYKPALANTANYYGSSVQRMSAPASQPVFTIANSGVGTGGADLGPRQAAGLITRFTAVAGRTGRGRIYFPFLPTAAMSTTGHLDAAWNTLLTAVGNSLLVDNTITTGFGTSIDANPQLVRNRVTYTTVTSFLVRPKIATQKRRGDYGRPNSLPW